MPEMYTDLTELLPGQGLPFSFSNTAMTRLAAELAAGLADKKTVLDNFGISPAQWDVLRTNPVFVGIMREQLVIWSGELAAPKRIKAKATVMAEDLLPDIYTIAKNPTAAAGMRLDAFKTLTKLADVETGERVGPSAGTQFSIVIDLGDRNVRIDGRNVGNQEIDNDIKRHMGREPDPEAESVVIEHAEIVRQEGPARASAAKALEFIEGPETEWVVDSEPSLDASRWA